MIPTVRSAICYALGRSDISNEEPIYQGCVLSSIYYVVCNLYEELWCADEMFSLSFVYFDQLTFFVGQVPLSRDWFELAVDISRKPLESQPQVAGTWRSSYDLFLAIPQFVDIPRSEDDLVAKKVCLWRSDPYEEIGGE